MFLTLLIITILAVHLNNHPDNLEIAVGKIAQSGVSAFEWLGDTMKH